MTRVEDNDDVEEAITVAIRMRPLLDVQQDQHRIWKVLPQHSSIAQTDSNGGPLSSPQATTTRTVFTFDKTFAEDASTQEIYDTVAQKIVSSAVNGLNGTVFCYGQTSSGKTYTMQGAGTIQQGHAGGQGGLLHLAARDIFQLIGQQLETRTFRVRVSFLEIYNEEVRDLLNNQAVLNIREDPQQGVFVNAIEEIVPDSESLLTVLYAGDKIRSFASTAMNERSSRSHTIIRIRIESRERVMEDEEEIDKEEGAGTISSNESSTEDDGTGPVLVSTLNFVDLAGSESVRHSNSTGERQKEGGLINQSLLSLSRVIVALGTTKPTHVNYRDSKLTRILQPALSGNARMAMICCATPSHLYLEETRSTLLFAARAKLVKTRAHLNEFIDDRTMVRRLQKQIASLLQQQARQKQALEELEGMEYEKLVAELCRLREENATLTDQVSTLTAEVDTARNLLDATNKELLQSSQRESILQSQLEDTERQRMKENEEKQEVLASIGKREKLVEELKDGWRRALKEVNRLRSQLAQQQSESAAEKEKLLSSFGGEKEAAAEREKQDARTCDFGGAETKAGGCTVEQTEQTAEAQSSEEQRQQRPAPQVRSMSVSREEEFEERIEALQKRLQAAIGEKNRAMDHVETLRNELHQALARNKEMSGKCNQVFTFGVIGMLVAAIGASIFDPF